MGASMTVNERGFFSTPGIGTAVIRVCHGKEDRLTVVPLKTGSGAHRPNAGNMVIPSTRKTVEQHSFNEAKGAVETIKTEVTELTVLEGQAVTINIRWKDRAPASLTVDCRGIGASLFLVPIRANWEPNAALDALDPHGAEEFSRFSRI